MSHIHTHLCNCAEESKGPGDMYSLYQNVDHDAVNVLNEERLGSGKSIIKPYDERLDETKVVQSSCDGELLFQIPFTNCVRLKALTVRAPSNGSGPSKMKIWVNRDDIDFSTCHDLKCSQELIVPQDALGEFKIVLKPALFQNTNTIAILFYAPYNDDDEISMSFLGFFGQPTTHKRQAVNVVYEAKANPKDHKTDASADVNPSTIN